MLCLGNSRATQVPLNVCFGNSRGTQVLLEVFGRNSRATQVPLNVLFRNSRVTQVPADAVCRNSRATHVHEKMSYSWITKEPMTVPQQLRSRIDVSEKHPIHNFGFQ
jgi:hypothetical protein